MEDCELLPSMLDLAQSGVQYWKFEKRVAASSQWQELEKLSDEYTLAAISLGRPAT